jgi:signal transduction histidine kinase
VWFDEIGSLLEPLLADLAASLDARPLAVWVLRTDGRHFLEETPSGEVAIGGPKLAEVATDLLFEPVEVVDPNETPDRYLLLEGLYPDQLVLPMGSARAVGEDSELYCLIHPESPRASRIVFSGEAGAVPEELVGQEGWACRLEDEGRVIGMIGFAGHLDEDIPGRFEETWNQQSWKWQKLQLGACLSRRTETLKATQAIGDTITSQLEIHDILQSVVEQATVLMRAKISSMMLVGEEGRTLTLESVYGSSPDYILKPDLSVSTSLLGRVVRSGRPIMVRDVRTCEAYAHRDLARTEGLVSLLAVPLKWRNTCMGVLSVYSAYRCRYTRDQVYLLSMLASQAAIAIQNARTLHRSKLLENQIHELDKRSLVGELAAGVAHEIRNPLAAVRMLIDSWDAVDEHQHEDLEVIRTQLWGINRCVSQLLETARPQPQEFATVGLNQEIGNTLQMLRVRLRDQEVQTDVDLMRELPPIRADAMRLRQFLMNLLLNALNAMPSGGLIQVRTRTLSLYDFRQLPGVFIHGSEDDEIFSREEGTQGVVLTLSDRGGGLREENLREMFEPFHSHRPGGFGIGLSVVKRIMQDHQAPLKVVNCPGEGLTYHALFEIQYSEEPS